MGAGNEREFIDHLQRKEVTMKEVDITRQCTAGLEFSVDGEALIYLYHYDKKIGLFDKNGFHFMHNTKEQYRVKDGYKAHLSITWFKVYERR